MKSLDPGTYAFTRTGGIWNWLEQLSDDAVAALNDAARPLSLSRGEVIYRRGEGVTAIYQVISGRLLFKVVSAQGKEVRYVHLERGDCFGELSIFDGKPAHHDAVADTDTVLIRLAASDFHRIRRSFPQIDEALLNFFARRVRSVYEIIDDAYLLDVPHRLARRLRSLYLTHQRDGLQGPIDVSHEDLAKMIGSTRQSVTAILKSWERDGWIAQTYGRIECLQPDRLAEFIKS